MLTLESESILEHRRDEDREKDRELEDWKTRT